MNRSNESPSVSAGGGCACKQAEAAQPGPGRLGLYTKREVVELLRLNEKRIAHPVQSITYLIRCGKLRARKVCGQILIEEQALRDYLETCER